jgi:hypothetical protein
MKELKITLAILLILTFGSVAIAESPVGFGFLFYDDMTVRTVVPPAAMPKPGKDDLYVVVDGHEDQLAIAAVAPGDRDYHGGKWAFHSVEWLVTPYLLTSEADVMEAASLKDVTIERVPLNDFKCPIQP